MDKIRVLIVDDNAQGRKDLSRLLYFEDDLEVVGEAENGEEGLKKVGELHPNIVLMDINMPVMDGITATEKISRNYPDSAVVMISIQGEQEYLKKAMVAGARDYLVKPVNSEETASTLRQVYNLEKARGKTFSSSRLTEEVEPEENRQVISVFSGKGGCGKSVIAANLAVSLAMQDKKTVIVDLDLQFGDLSLMLNLSDIKPISDLVEEPEGINEQTLSRYLLRHGSGLLVISSCFSPQDGEKVKEEHVNEIIDNLKSSFDFIIIDTPSVFNETTLPAIEKSDMIIMPMLCDLASIKNARSSLEVLDALNCSDKVQLVLNMEGPSYGIGPDDVSLSLKRELYHSIPRDDKNISLSINKGVTVVAMKTPTEVGRSLMNLRDKISPAIKTEVLEEDKKGEKVGFLGKVMGGMKGGA